MDRTTIDKSDNETNDPSNYELSSDDIETDIDFVSSDQDLATSSSGFTSTGEEHEEEDTERSEISSTGEEQEEEDTEITTRGEEHETEREEGFLRGDDDTQVTTDILLTVY
jgi:hypothetical protein